jgi:hypothetical protein
VLAHRIASQVCDNNCTYFIHAFFLQNNVQSTRQADNIWDAFKSVRCEILNCLTQRLVAE